MDNIINLSPSPRALHFAAIWPKRRGWIFLVLSLALFAFSCLIFWKAMSSRSEDLMFYSIIVALFVSALFVYALNTARISFRDAKRLTDMIKPGFTPIIGIDKANKKISILSKKGSEAISYDLIIKVQVEAAADELERKYKFHSISIKYLAFSPEWDDININTITFDHLENAPATADLIRQGEPAMREIWEKLSPWEPSLA